MGCRRRDSRRQLLRVVAGAGPDGRPAVVPDPRGTAPGRGAHLHPTTDCLTLAERRRAFPRALRVEGAMDLAALRMYLNRAEPTQNWSTSS
ncbi:YlxR family protein [Nocardioides mangrovicus]|uniref:YlxR family protein n=1 Tax=Nocardioides mangrovicus TaxID=2478913 RepID=UPI0022B7AC8B|nr:YlxR family protein [Nocardioides mangrovicus]